MPKLGELNFKDPSPDAQLKKNDDDDIYKTLYRNIEIPKGVYSQKSCYFKLREK